ncbi:uncharacterized protein LOC129594551 isoform X3 [Paramacrobiotus metropolitanus]|uniref:uncharacterized protein LOC129594551 isoform X3 n=1 Tax=Paramacrobiotus metropolitanus TaxID=2943436 RepID=UPI002445BFDF|nr:uncharacterized protein LOC129594551 isoform X3 [Paramacrobiotus metropolitanus]
MFGFPFRRNWGIAKFRPPFPYTLEEPIGHGGLSRAVYKVTDESSEETYAVKAIPVISGTPDAELRKHLHEFKTIVKLSARPHRNVVRYYYFDVARWDAGPEVRLFMEYCNGHNLAGRNESLAASKQRLKEHDIVRDLKDILRGLQYLHRNGIVHLDIKGGNILITTTGVVKLADFGLITKIQGAVTASGEVNGAAGTTVYMAPERFSGVFGRCGRASDVWSVGCVLLEMLHGHAPRFYRRESRGKMMLMVRLPEIEAALATGEKPCYFHPGSKEDPQKLGRKGCHDSKEFLRTGKDFLDSCFRLTAADRPTAAALLQHPLLTVKRGKRPTGISSKSGSSTNKRCDWCGATLERHAAVDRSIFIAQKSTQRPGAFVYGVQTYPASQQRHLSLAGAFTRQQILRVVLG